MDYQTGGVKTPKPAHQVGEGASDLDIGGPSMGTNTPPYNDFKTSVKL